MDAERIRVIPPGLDHRFGEEPRRPAAPGGRLRRRRARRQPADARGRARTPGFLLCLGTDYSHKNRVFALRLLAALRERHGWQGGWCWPARTSRTAPRGRPSARSWTRTRSCARPWSSWARSSEAEKEWLMRRSRRGAVPVGVRGFRAGPVREPRCAAFRACSRPRPRWRRERWGRPRRSSPGTPSQSAAAAYQLLTDPAARARHVRAAGRRRTRADVGARSRGDGRGLPRGRARPGARCDHAQPRRGRPRTAADRRPPSGRAAADRRTRAGAERLRRAARRSRPGAQPDRPARLAARGSPARAARAQRAPAAQPAAVRASRRRLPRLACSGSRVRHPLRGREREHRPEGSAPAIRSSR